MKAAKFVVGILTLAVAVLQLVHDAYGVGVAPISAAREVYRDITGDNPTDSQSADVSADEIVESAQELDEAMDELIEESFDSTPPTPPSNLRIAEQNECVVNLEWDPSTDDEELSAYRVYSNGSFDGMVDEKFTEFEVRLFPGDSRTFTVIAVDGSANESKRSNEATASCS
jgi:hypothetical protein